MIILRRELTDVIAEKEDLQRLLGLNNEQVNMYHRKQQCKKVLDHCVEG